MPPKARARGKSKGGGSRTSLKASATSSAEAADRSQRRATWSGDRALASTSPVEASTIRAFQIIQAKIQAKIQAGDSVTDEVQANGSKALHELTKKRQAPVNLEAEAAADSSCHEEASEAKEEPSGAEAQEEVDALADGEQDLVPEKLREIPDPWFGLCDDDAMQRIYRESWNVVELPNLGDEGTVQEELADLPEIEGYKSVHISAKGAELSKVCLYDPLVSVAVSLDLSGNLLQDVEMLPPMWLRSLSLADNPLSSLSNLAPRFPRLLCIDLSFVDLAAIPEAWGALAVCTQLRSIDAEGASIQSLEGMQQMPSLLVLNLADNELEELHVLSAIGSLCKSLQCLDLRENPVVSETGYRQLVAQKLPQLVEHDNQSKRKYVPKPRDQICLPNQARQKAVHVIDGLLQNERCSCLEGNPCTDPATCLDWHNREKVASNVRQSFHLPQGQWSLGFNFRG